MGYAAVSSLKGVIARVVIDAHQHFWAYDPRQYGWITHEMAPLRRDFLPDHLQPLMAEKGIDGCVAVQARQHTTETAWLLSLGDDHDFIKGVVGWVDLIAPDVAKTLEQFKQYEKFKGVRHIVQSEPDDLFMLRKDFRRGIGIVGDMNLTYDLLIYPVHLPVATELVDMFPNQKFVVNHIAKPYIKEKIISPWREQIADLAQRPHVMCKVSGLVTEAHWNDWREKDFRPYLDIVMESFGPYRVMLGSDWPVCTLACSYDQAWDIALNYVNTLSADEKKAILGGNAVSFYDLA